jgi:predicted permease
VIAVISSLIPVFALIAMGYAMRRLNFLGAEFWPLLERLTYFALFPALLFHALASADFQNAPIGRLGLVLGGMMLAMSAVLIVLRPFVARDGPAFTSMFQGAVRWNSFVAIAAIAAVYGAPGLSLAAVAIAIMVPLANVLSVVVLIRYGGPGSKSARLVLEQIIRNPLIQACVLGIAVKSVGLTVPGPILATADMMGKASLTLGLFAVGASLDFAVARIEAHALAIACVLKLLLMPLLAFGLCLFLGVDGTARGCALICAAVPGAASSYILAKQLGGDGPLMASITTAQTLAAMFTMPLMLGLLI